MKTSIIFLFWVEWPLQNVTFELFHDGSHTFSAPNRNPPCWMLKLVTFSQHQTISDGTWTQHQRVQLSGWRKWGNLLNSVPLDRHKHQGCHRWAGSVSVGVHLASKKIPLLLFHYKILTLKGENIRAKQKTKKVNKNRTDFSNVEFKHSAVTKWNVFLTQVSSLSGRFCHMCIYLIIFHSVSI